MRDLHLCTGLFLSPFVLVFALSTVLLNHAWVPWEAQAGAEVRTVRLDGRPPAEADRLATARWIAERAGVAGEIENVFLDGDAVRVPVALPGAQIEIHADLAAGTARVERRATSLWDRLIYLHRSPGPHLAGFRGNWVFTRVWRALADATVALLLFSGASGIYLWLLVRAQRRTGLACLGGGTLLFALLLAGLTA